MSEVYWIADTAKDISIPNFYDYIWDVINGKDSKETSKVCMPAVWTKNSGCLYEG